MNAIENSLNVLNRNQKLQIISLLKQCIRVIITTTDIKTQIWLSTQYKSVAKQFIKIAASQININDPRIIKYFLDFIIKHTTRGYLFPSTFESLLLELIQILEYTCVLFPNETYV